MKWSTEELQQGKRLLNAGKNFKEIAAILNKSHNSVSKKLRREGLMFKEVSTNQVPKYLRYNWKEIQKFYEHSTYRGIIVKFKVTPQTIQKAIEDGLLQLRDKKEATKASITNGRRVTSKKTGIEKYRLDCNFNFNLSDFPDEFDFSLIEKYGWYKPKNRGNNPNGVSRDHKYSIKEGFKNNISPEILRHPANCQLMRHVQNNTKKSNCSVSLEELHEAIHLWNRKYIIAAETPACTNVVQHPESGVGE